VNTDLVTGSADAPDEIWVALSDIAQHEEGRPHAECLEEIQQTFGVGLEARFVGVPLLRLAIRAGQTLKPVLQVDSEGVYGGDR
jgi:hypothetical protein